MNDRVRAILDAASKAPWIADVRVGTVQVYSGAQRDRLDSGGRTVMSRTGEVADGRWTLDDRDKADARAIVLSRNLLPVALDVVEAARAVWGHAVPDEGWGGSVEYLVPAGAIQALRDALDAYDAKVKEALG